MSQTLTKPILLDETGQAIKTALQNIDETESQDWLLTYEDVHSEMDDNVDRIATALESIQSILESGEWYVKDLYIQYGGSSTFHILDEFDISKLTVYVRIIKDIQESYIQGDEMKEVDVTNQCTLSLHDGDLMSPSNSLLKASWFYGKTGITYTAEYQFDVRVYGFNEKPELAMKSLQAHYQNLIDIHDYWTVGDTNGYLQFDYPLYEGDTNTTDRMNTTELVLLNVGGKELAEPINGHTECAFIIGFTDMMNYYKSSYSHYNADLVGIDTNASDPESYTGNWSTCTLRTYFNTDFKGKMYQEDSSGKHYYPDGFFKKFKNISSSDVANTGIVETEDFFSIPSEKELFGTTTLDNETVEQDLFQFDWYKDTTNLIPRTGLSGYGTLPWMRTMCNETTDLKRKGYYVMSMRDTGDHVVYARAAATGEGAMLPFGCI